MRRAQQGVSFPPRAQGKHTSRPQHATPRHLLLDPGTLNALSIFRQESHPSLMGIGTSKEGFSLFGLLNRCVTQMVGTAGAGWTVLSIMQAYTALHGCLSASLRPYGGQPVAGKSADSAPLTCHSPMLPCCQGKALLRQWCLSPVADLRVLGDRHDSVEALMSAPDLAESLRATLRKVGRRCGGRR